MKQWEKEAKALRKFPKEMSKSMKEVAKKAVKALEGAGK